MNIVGIPIQRLFLIALTGVVLMTLFWCGMTIASGHLGYGNLVVSFDPLQNGVTITNTLSVLTITTVLVLAIWRGGARQEVTYQPALYRLKRFTQDPSQLHDYLLGAFRSGILHPQIY